MRRVLEVTRILTVNWFWVLVFPMLLVLAILAFNVALFGVLSSTVAEPDDLVTGGITALYLVVGITHLQTMTQLFPFAMSLGVTRRAFYAATSLLVAAQAAGYALSLVLLRQLELATGGWGIGLRFFGLPFLPLDNPAALWAAYAVPMLPCAAAGVLLGVVFKRWGQPGIWTVLLGGATVLVGVAVLVTWQAWWPAVGAFFVTQPPLALLAGYPLALALLLGGAGWLTLRRATP